MRTRAALAVVLLLTALPVTAHAHGSKAERRTQTYRVTFHYVEPPGTFSGIVCDGFDAPENAAVDTCRYKYKGKAFFSGDVTGVQEYELENWMGTNGRMHYRGPVTFYATVAGCGEGSFKVYEKGYIKLLESDPQTRRTPGFNTWRVLPDTATGTLKGRLLGGRGVNHWSADGTKTDNDFGRGTFTGTITCQR